MSDNLGKELLKEGKRRQTSIVASQVASSQNRLLFSMFRGVPRPLQWMVPIVTKTLQKSPIKLDKLTQKFKKIQGKGKKIQKPLKKLPKSITGRFTLEPETLEEVEEVEEVQETAPVEEEVQPNIEPLYEKYNDCHVRNPFYCDFPREAVEKNPDAKYCQKCQFPALLAPETKLRGAKEIYQIEKSLGYRGIGRLYQAIQPADQQPVIIKEYLLPSRYFNKIEIKQYQERFLSLGALHLADNRFQDFRLIVPWEAIADVNQERCYLVYKSSLYTAPTLASYLEKTGAMTNGQVQQMLNQVLQSLHCLHRQKFRWRSGLVRQGIPHGNINLETLTIVPNLQGFFIYLCDIASWESLFLTEKKERTMRWVQQDLKDLGNLAFYLLAGKPRDEATGEKLDPMLEANWPESVKPELKSFIFNLMELGDRRFDNAEVARLALLKIPPDLVETVEFTNPEENLDKPVKKWNLRKVLWVLLGIGAVLLLGYLIWYFLVRNRDGTDKQEMVCCVNKVTGFPPGIFRYAAKKHDTWDNIVLSDNIIRKGTTLQAELNKLLNPEAKDGKKPPKIQLIYQPEASSTGAIAKVRNGDAYFTISNLVNVEKFYGNLLYRDLDYEIIAYDGLVFFVAFSYNKREKSIPAYLNGQITFEQLRQLYTGKITNWQQLGGPDMPVKLYIPDRTEAVQLFEDTVLRDKNLIQQFQALQKSEVKSNSFVANPPLITRPGSMTELLRSIIRDFEREQQVGAIAFGPLSQVFNQCSVYPLALKADNQETIAPLIQNNQEPITSQTDLCNNKGSYGPNLDALISQSYPLVYPMALVYLKDNRLLPVGPKFAEVLRTLEVQRLLTKTGLIPIETLPREDGDR